MTPEVYYSDQANYGDYQYVAVDDMLTNFMLNYVGDDKIINNIDRHTVLFHLKRGLQELNYDALKEVKVISLEISETFTIPLPHDYVNYVRFSWLDANGKFRPMLPNRNSKIATAYLQDHEYNILFDGDGYPITTLDDTINIDTTTSYNVNSYYASDDYDVEARYTIDPAKANVNGVFVIDKRLGIVQFSSNVSSKTIVIEYISDGTEFADDSDIKINKLAEQALYDYVSWAILSAKYGVQEYIITRERKKYINSKKRAKLRIGGFRYDELLQVLRGKDKRIK